MSAMPQRSSASPWSAAIWIWLLAGIVLYLLSLVIMAPATLVPWYLSRQGPQQPILLNDVRGTLWQGSAGQASWRSPTGPLEPLGQAQWRVHVLPLLVGKVKISLRVNGPAGQMRMDLQPQGQAYRLTDVTGKIPMSYLTPRLGQFSALDPKGTLVLDLPELQFGPQSFQGRGKVDWQLAGFGLSPINPLGNYRLNLQGRQLRLETLSGPLRLNARGEIERDSQRLTLNGTAQASGPEAGQLQPVLSFLGPAQGNGAHAFNFKFSM